MGLSEDKQEKVYLGAAYGNIYIFSSMASKNMCRLIKNRSSDRLFSLTFDVTAVLSLILFIAIRGNTDLAVIGIFSIVVNRLMDITGEKAAVGVKESI